MHIVAFSLFGLSAQAADFSIIAFQGEAPSEAAQALGGHWRMAKIVFESPRTSSSSSILMAPRRTGS